MEKSERHFDNLRTHFAGIIRQNALWLRSMILPRELSAPLKQKASQNKKIRFSQRTAT